ncbi:MAG: hypothetical protein HZC40_08140 [Chloroflexi bacterium]|nr:hypothetical protein [Chloroflexota bacterium]
MFNTFPTPENFSVAMQIPARVLALDAPAPIARAFATRALAQSGLRGASVGVILGDNYFDAYALARVARAAQRDPATILARIELSRAFTCYQLHHRIATLNDTHLNRWRALYVTGLLDPFYDESVEYAEAAHLLQETLARLKHIAARGVPVLVTLSPSKLKTRAGLAQLAAQNVEAYWRIESPPIATQTEMTFARLKGTAHGTNAPDLDATHSRI